MTYVHNFLLAAKHAHINLMLFLAKLVILALVIRYLVVLAAMQILMLFLMVIMAAQLVPI